MTAGSAPAHHHLEPLSKRERLADLTKTSVAKVKELRSDPGTTPETAQDTDAESEAHLEFQNNNPAFTTRLLHDQIRSNEKFKRTDSPKGLKAIGKAIVQPKQTLKKQAKKVTAGKLSTVERSFISQTADLELLDAHDELEEARRLAPSPTANAQSADQELPLIESHNRLKDIEKQRESLQAAWITNHQVFRVRVVPSTPFMAPQAKGISSAPSFEIWGREVLQFIGRGLLFYLQDSCTMYVDEDVEPRIDIITLRKSVERLIVASAAWQSWLYDIGTIYRWENPLRTGRWLAIFIILWYTEHIVGFVYCYILYIVLKNRYCPASVQSVRDSIERAANSQRQATRFVELIDKYGAENWIDAVIEEAGPSLQLLAVDAANYAEILVNFYQWKAPFRTCATLSFFAACLAVSCMTDMAFCVKLVWFVAGGTFFLLWPIASHYPQYRVLVSPVRWVLWDIPTHSEWAFQYLRLHAQEARQEIVRRKFDHKFAETFSVADEIDVNPHHDSNATKLSCDEQDSSSASSGSTHLADEDIRAFRAMEGLVPGRLIISTDDVRFAETLTGNESWRLPYVQLSMMWKSDSALLSKVKTTRGRLMIQEISGAIHKLEGIRERDDAFNNIIAFSGLRWQNSQPK